MKIMFFYSAFENLGIEYLSAVLKKSGHETRLLFDPGLFNDPFITISPLRSFFNFDQYLLDQAIAYAPDIFVFSATSSTYLNALQFAKKIKHLMGKKIVFGGIHPTSVPQDVIAEQAIDYVIVGEGEEVLTELVDCLQAGKPVKGIGNLWFKEKEIIKNNSVRPLINDLDCLPFPDKDLYYRIIPEFKTGYTIITRRGCPNICSYCYTSVLKKLYPQQPKVRIRSVNNVIEELRYALAKYNFKRLRINDDLFTSDSQWLEDFSQQYVKYITRPVFCFVSPAHVNPAIVKNLKQIGCYQVCMGVQSVSQEVRENILHRFHSNQQIENAIKLFRRFKIRCVVDNIIGLPGEQEADLLAMLKFYNQNRPNRICVFKLIYFPQTDIAAIGLKAKVIDQEYMDTMAKQPNVAANTVHNRTEDKNKRLYHLLLIGLRFFPKRFIEFIIKRKLYLYIPLINPSLIETPLSMVARDRLDIVRRRYYTRYIKFSLKLILSKIRLFRNKKILNN
ncbi:MAG: B12-binding domain-containing radical SAM protein [Candidatus Omnitrophica bacterium]|nr:B12-binding domain-containing radical SAM protein [Candidatus Omnitrophota bacterium]